MKDLNAGIGTTATTLGWEWHRRRAADDLEVPYDVFEDWVRVSISIMDVWHIPGDPDVTIYHERERYHGL